MLIMRQTCGSMLDVTARRAVLALVSISTLVLAGCSGSDHHPISPPPPISVTTTSLPNGQVGDAYAATLTATGGMAPLSWAVSSGALRPSAGPIAIILIWMPKTLSACTSPIRDVIAAPQSPPCTA